MDREAEFTAFVSARGATLRRTAYLMTGDWDEAQDIVQTSLAKLYVAWPRVESAGAESYVRRVIANVFVDGRRRSWRREHPTEVLPEQTAVSVGDTEDRLVLLEALATLPPAHRAVLVLRFWEDMSVEQVSDALSIPVGTVKSQSARGLEKLRAVLGVDLALAEGERS
jgi:RNA polymerase sigma-70 factor (sigma-E family)